MPKLDEIMIATRPFILYSLPKSRTTQTLFGRRIRKAYNNVSSFLEKCTTADPNKPKSLRLTAYTPSGIDESIDYATELIEDAISNFGKGTTNPIGFFYPNGKPIEQKVIEWTLNSRDLDSAIQFLEKKEPFPKFNLGPIELSISYEFKLYDLESNKELPDQQYTSDILVWLSRSNNCSLTLYLPFERADKKFYDYLDNLTPLLPCKLERKYLRLGQANKQKSSNKYTKLI